MLAQHSLNGAVPLGGFLEESHSSHERIPAGEIFPAIDDGPSGHGNLLDHPPAAEPSPLEKLEEGQHLMGVMGTEW